MSTPLYETTVTAHGGRAGHAESTDGRLAVSLSVPQSLGGAGGPGTNPEQLFAAGYAACYDSALRLVARKRQVDLPADTAITARVSLARTETSLYQLAVKLTARLPGLPEASARALMETAHQVCPYSNATRGNITVTLALEDESNGNESNGNAGTEGATGASAAA
jgi:lipoyl-dependent peroxiredoxin